ncbi:MAG TPA: hypothetical protein VGS07_24155 [Thermoanaerobaculia bacterium]|jgi:hypothetical protein|nr:hypothetical protein [Thermoanaerobaculia bacterium]
MARQLDTLDAIRHPPNRKVLRRLHLTTLDDVWREIGKDLDGLDPLVQAGADRSHLIRDLMASAVHDANENGASWPRRHFLDLVLAAVALGLAALLIWAVPRASSVGIALRDLRTGERVSTDSLHGADPDQIADRRLTRDVPRGGYVRPEWLAPVPALGDQALQGRFRMFLHLHAEDLRLLPTLPARATLGISAGGKEPPQALLLHDIPILAAEKSGDTATLDAAFTDTELRSLLPLLPHAEIRVVRPSP